MTAGAGKPASRHRPGRRFHVERAQRRQETLTKASEVCEVRMKGPYERLKYDLRRVFECPRCRRRVRLPGSVTFFYCTCADPEHEGHHVLMKLVEECARRPWSQPLESP